VTKARSSFGISIRSRLIPSFSLPPLNQPLLLRGRCTAPMCNPSLQRLKRRLLWICR
jgi:hypothetical protein